VGDKELDRVSSRDGTLGLWTKLGGVYGLYFYLQANAYATGGADALKETSISALVAHGVRHLSHILAPFSGVAWPLSPTLCGLLVLYVVVLPHQLRRARTEAVAMTANRWFFAVVGALSIIAFGALLLRACPPVFEFFIALRGTAWIYVEWLAYLALTVGWTLFAYRVLGHRFDRLAALCRDDEPWADIIAALCLAWLFLLAFIGAEFDANLDMLAKKLVR